MLKSLFSGVSGLQSHQVAMDVESNNIANVNTTGYKYSRANFSDLLAQTKSIATAPQGALGGKNAVQVGLGSTVSSMTRMFAQGSVQSSDKNTDVAIQGDGFFIISPDGGNTYKYTRSGDFKFDAGGNFVDNNGFIAQGWLRDPDTGKVDSTASITDINIAPGLTTPAQASTEIVLKANLNPGVKVESYSPAYEVKTGSTGATPALDKNGNAIASGDMGVLFNESGEAFSLQEGQGVWASFRNASVTAGTVVANTALDITFNVDPEMNIPGNTVNITAPAGATIIETANNYVAAINAQSSVTGIKASVDAGNTITLVNDNSLDSASHNIDLAVVTSGSGLAAATSVTAHRYLYNATAPSNVPGGDKAFTTIANMREWLEAEAQNQGFLVGGTLTNGITVEVDDAGKFVIKNPTAGVDDFDVNFNITGYTNKTATPVTENVRFTRNMKALNATLTAGTTASAYSQGFNAATHSSSIDVFDSLGSKHTLRMEFRKTDKNAWGMTVTVPEPATIDTIPPTFEKTGRISFNDDGSLASYNPPSVSFSGNNGSAPDQQVNLSFGTSNAFDGMTSFDSPSSTSGISQDGFTGGDLVGIRIDQSGTLVGSFSNGRSFGLAQIGMAKFTNNEGLSVEGGNVFIQTSNSGDPIIGTAATAGRGFIQSSALEASNVDLSRALTQLIIVQRGFQANGKTITTSDQLLQTLIGLKN